MSFIYIYGSPIWKILECGSGGLHACMLVCMHAVCLLLLRVVGDVADYLFINTGGLGFMYRGALCLFAPHFMLSIKVA